MRRSSSDEKPSFTIPARIKRYVTNTLVIGNGPSGLAMSAILSGVRPYFDDEQTATDSPLDERLRANAQTSLVDQDLSDIASRLGGAGRLFDSLERPGADLNDPQPSCIQYKYEPEERVPHIVVASDDYGGSWNHFPYMMRTASIGEWFDLPAFTYIQHERQQQRATFTDNQANGLGGPGTSQAEDRLPWLSRRLPPEEGGEVLEESRKRPTIEQVRRYFANYVDALQLQKYMHTGVRIHSLKFCERSNKWFACGNCAYHDRELTPQRDQHVQSPCTGDNDIEACWAATDVIYEADIVCLASGTRVPRMLGIPGECKVIHSLQDLELALSPCRNPLEDTTELDDRVFERCMSSCTDESRTSESSNLSSQGSCTNPSSKNAQICRELKHARLKSSIGYRSQVLVVGDGLSAADAVIRCIGNSVKVHHVFTRNSRQLKTTLLGRVAANTRRNGDYAIVLQAMMGRSSCCDWYKPYSMTNIERIDGRSVTLRHLKTGEVTTVEDIDQVIALIGWTAHVPFLMDHSLKAVAVISADGKRMIVDPATNAAQSADQPRLYAVGQIAGDNFVRHMSGGVVNAARGIVAEARKLMRQRLDALPSLIAARHSRFVENSDVGSLAGQLLLESAAAIIAHDQCHVTEHDLRRFLCGETMLIGWAFIAKPDWVNTAKGIMKSSVSRRTVLRFKYSKLIETLTLNEWRALSIGDLALCSDGTRVRLPISKDIVSVEYHGNRSQSTPGDERRFDLLLRQPHCVCGDAQLTSSYQEIVASWWSNPSVELHPTEDDSELKSMPCVEWICCEHATTQNSGTGNDCELIGEPSPYTHKAHHYSAAQPCSRCGVSAARHFRAQYRRTTSMNCAVNDRFVNMHRRCEELMENQKNEPELPRSTQYSPISNGDCFLSANHDRAPLEEVDSDNELPEHQVKAAIQKLYTSKRHLGISRLSSVDYDEEGEEGGDGLLLVMGNKLDLIMKENNESTC